ncbi:MAG: hypothetical protein EAZ57_11075 [Cytophagales bacterium]|nr:MAG: hypothetical protein EAZ67_11560 [Cytophagales bacterium]TAF59511.1 MAG: hypothetical protein EAZ57_11075 [Cytophagales bacterium]
MNKSHNVQPEKPLRLSVNHLLSHVFWIILAGTLLGLLLWVATMPQVVSALWPHSRGLVRISSQEDFWADQKPKAEEKAFIAYCVEIAKARNQHLFGDLKSKPRCIFLFKPQNITHFLYKAPVKIASTFYFGRPFIIFSMYKLTPDISSHEFCHAELYHRLGGSLKQPSLPQWFDEGLALQVDGRYTQAEQYYNLEHKNLPQPKELASAQDFYRNPDETHLRNHLLSYFWVKQWLKRHKQSGLNKLIQNIKKEQVNFDTLVLKNHSVGSHVTKPRKVKIL